MTKRAFIFDMDGTIVDNMDFHLQSWLAFLARHGKQVQADEFFRATAGRQGKEIMRAYLGHDISDHDNARLNEEKEAVYRELYAPHRKTIEGFDAFLARAKQSDVCLAVATSAPDENIAFTLDGLGLRQHFDAVVGAADVERGKPEPDCFLKAAARCGADPADCIVFEDAPLGVEAARRAGMRAVVLTTTLPASAFTDYDNVVHIASDFSDIAIDDLFAA